MADTMMPKFSFSLPAMRAQEFAIDLGTANTVIYNGDGEELLNEPSYLARDQRTRIVLAVGQEARRMEGMTPDNIQVIRPLREGVVTDIDSAVEMLIAFVAKARQDLPWSPRFRIALGIPGDATQVERRALEEACAQLGAKDHQIVEEPIAAAIGAGLDISEAQGQLLIDVGGGSTEMAVISLGGTVVSGTTRFAGDHFTLAIREHIRKELEFGIGEQRAEDLKIGIGVPTKGKTKKGASGKKTSLSLSGWCMRERRPTKREMDPSDLEFALEPGLRILTRDLRKLLAQCPPQVAADLVENGITLCGGGALLAPLKAALHESTQLPVQVADDPLGCVARGLGIILQESRGKSRANKKKWNQKFRQKKKPMPQASLTLP